MRTLINRHTDQPIGLVGLCQPADVPAPHDPEALTVIEHLLRRAEIGSIEASASFIAWS